MNSRSLKKLPRRRWKIYPSKDSFTFYHPRRREMKPKKIKSRTFPFVLIIILFILMGCFFVPSGSDRYSKDQNNVSSKHVVQFFSKVKPSHSYIDSQYRYAIHLQKIGKHKISVEVLNDIARYDPSNPKTYNALGISYDALADFKKANKVYQKALKLDPNLDYVHNNLGYSQLLQKDYESAKKSFRQAISLADKNSDINKYENNLTLANAKSGTLDETAADNEKTVDDDDIEQIQADTSTIEDEAQVPDDAIYQTPEIILAAADSTNLDPKDEHASANFSDMKKDRAPHLSDNSNTNDSNTANSNLDHSKLDVAKTEPEKEMYWLQVGALRKLQNAERVQRKLSDEVDNLYISEAHIKGTRYYRVRVGPFSNILAAEKTQSRLKSIKGIQGFTSRTPMKPEKDVYAVQVGAMREFENADNLKRILSKEVDNIYISEADIRGIRYYRVRVGPFKNILDAEVAMRRLKNAKSVKGFIAYQSPGAYAYNRANTVEAIAEGDPAGFKAGIEVSNGNGINRMARRVGNFLSQRGFKIMRLTNAITFNIKKTIIYFTKGYREKAVYVENQFPGNQVIEEVQSNNRPGIQLKIVIGDDLRTHDRKLFVDNYEPDGFASRETRYGMAGNDFGG